jgi:site-specific recombinase XerD
MLKRRLKDAGLSDAFSPHSFRATGITNFLENGGTLEVAQRIAGHADSRTTQLYDRRGQKVLLEDMERIRYRAIQQFLAWSERAGYQHLEDIEPITVDGEVQKLLDAIETSTHTGLRDRALLGVLAYTFARIGAVVNLKVEDYYPSGKRFLLRFKEKGGKEKELPVHHKLEELLDQYLKLTGLGEEPGSPLFPAALGKTGKLSRRPLVRTDAADMLKRRLKQAGLPAHYSPHSFRATGITNFLENDGTLEAAQRIAGHADSRTTKLYDRRGQKVLLEDMERIRY